MKLDWRPDEHNFFLAAKNIKVDLDLKVRLDKIGSDETWSGAKKKLLLRRIALISLQLATIDQWETQE